MLGHLQELLRYTDRNSMAHSREVRLPFLDHRLVELCFRLPFEYKLNGASTKDVMRRALRDVLPEEVRAARWLLKEREEYLEVLP